MSRSTPASASVEVPVVQLETKANNRTFFSRIRRMPRAWVGLAFVLLVLLSALFAPMLTQLDPLAQFRDGLSDVGTPLPPNAQYILAAAQRPIYPRHRSSRAGFVDALAIWRASLVGDQHHCQCDSRHSRHTHRCWQGITPASLTVCSCGSLRSCWLSPRSSWPWVCAQAQYPSSDLDFGCHYMAYSGPGCPQPGTLCT